MRKILHPKTIDKIVEMYEKGKTYSEIAKNTGVSLSTVYNYTKLMERFESSYGYEKTLTRERENSNIHMNIGII